MCDGEGRLDRGGPRRERASFATVRDTLRPVFERHQMAGAVGPGDVDVHMRHAAGFAEIMREVDEGLVVDLGSGGGLPGLVLAALWPGAEVLLVESRGRRVGLLERAVAELGWAGRVQVRGERAELVARDPAVRGRAVGVVARSFGPPAVVAECGAPFLIRGGLLVVSEPPETGTARWPEGGVLEQLGLSKPTVCEADGSRYVRLEALRECGDRFPRRPGVPEREPLW